MLNKEVLNLSIFLSYFNNDQSQWVCPLSWNPHFFSKRQSDKQEENEMITLTKCIESISNHDYVTKLPLLLFHFIS